MSLVLRLERILTSGLDHPAEDGVDTALPSSITRMGDEIPLATIVFDFEVDMGVMVLRFVASDDSGVLLLFSTFSFSCVCFAGVDVTPNFEHFRFQYVASFLHSLSLRTWQ